MKSKRKNIMKRLDKLWSKIIRKKLFCELCGRTIGKHDAHHIEGRGTIFLRYSLDNGICLCAMKCHRGGVHSTASSVQAEYRQKIILLRGKDVIDELAKYRYITTKWYYDDFVKMEIKFKELLND